MVRASGHRNHHLSGLSADFAGSPGFNLAPLLTSAGVAGVAIGLAAQNIVKDCFNGFLILIDDQFNVWGTRSRLQESAAQ